MNVKQINVRIPLILFLNSENILLDTQEQIHFFMSNMFLECH